MSDCPIDLKECETFCNEKQIFPAMRYFVRELDLSVREASRQIRKLTKGAVTDRRAAMVYNNRTPVSHETPSTPPDEEPEENQEDTNESHSAEPEKETTEVDYDDIKDKKLEQDPTSDENPDQRDPKEIKEHSYAFQFADIAISQLGHIENDFPYAKDALLKVRDWVENKIIEVGEKP